VGVVLDLTDFYFFFLIFTEVRGVSDDVLIKDGWGHDGVSIFVSWPCKFNY
jgi:hypothetical protein